MRGLVLRCLLAASLSLACAPPLSAQVIYQTGLVPATGGTLTSPTVLTQLTVNTGADNTVVVCKDASLTTYNMISLNGTCADATAMGLLGGATADGNLYINSKSGSNLQYRVNGTAVWGVGATGTMVIGQIGDVKDQSFVVSSSALNKTDVNFATVTGLSVSLSAGKAYACHGHLTVTAAPAAGGIKVALNTSDTLTVTSMSVTALNMNAAVVNARTTATALNTAVGAATATATDIDIDAGIVVNAAGTLVVQAAQNAASGTTTVGPNSTFWCKRTS